jgi:hypothetical protein
MISFRKGDFPRGSPAGEAAAGEDEVWQYRVVSL